MLPFIFLVVGILAQQTFAEEPEAIVGGTAAVPGEYPHQGSLRVNGRHICGCSILNENTILTAAHCVHGIVTAPYYNVQVATGSIDATKGELHPVLNVYVHPQYSDRREDAWKNDVAVIKLGSRITYNQYQKPIALADSPPSDRQQCQLSGFGMIRANGPLSPVLLKMDQGVIAKNQCQQTHYGMPLTDGHLCALAYRGVGACQGDSGGPFICGGKQYGVTSWVMPCAMGVPDVYTNVYYFRNWIRQYM